MKRLLEARFDFELDSDLLPPAEVETIANEVLDSYRKNHPDRHSAPVRWLGLTEFRMEIVAQVGSFTELEELSDSIADSFISALHHAAHELKVERGASTLVPA